MIYLLSIPLGILFGLLLDKIGAHNRFSYIISVLPYSIFFWLTWEDREFWGPYRIAALIGSLIACVVWRIKEKHHDKNLKMKNEI